MVNVFHFQSLMMINQPFQIFISCKAREDIKRNMFQHFLVEDDKNVSKDDKGKEE